MKYPEKQIATKPVMIYEDTHIRIKAACDKANAVKRKGIKRLTIAEYIDRRVEK